MCWQGSQGICGDRRLLRLTCQVSIRKKKNVIPLLVLKTYIAGSYPHPVEDENGHRNERREIAFSPNLPASLERCLQGLIQSQNISQAGNRYCTLKPGCFVMNVASWAPQGLEWSLVTGDDPPSALWSVYSWRVRQTQAWNNDPSRPITTRDGASVIAHPALAECISHIHKPGDHQGGDLSYVALGDSTKGQVESFFIRLTDSDKNWYYRFDGLPKACNRAIQKYMVASRPDENGHHRWTLGRIRAVTLGQGDGWILYRENESWTDFGGDYLPVELIRALERGRAKGWTVNQAALNSNDYREYVLAFNEGYVFYSFHESFKDDFDKVATQWANFKGVSYIGKPVLLTDAHYLVPPLPQAAARNNNQAWGVTPAQQQQTPNPTIVQNVYNTPPDHASAAAAAAATSTSGYGLSSGHYGPPGIGYTSDPRYIFPPAMSASFASSQYSGPNPRSAHELDIRPTSAITSGRSSTMPADASSSQARDRRSLMERLRRNHH